MTANQLVQHFSAGDRIGEYLVERRIRSGAMATLFLARRSGAAGFSRVAAIKVIQPHAMEDERLIRMFVDEARILSRIAHPNVVHVEELRESAGLLYLVMEYVAGCSASQLVNMLRVQGEKLPVALAVHIAMKTAEGLHAAHETTDDEGRHIGIVHRNVSPSNILISTEGHVKLIDFGFAKASASARDTWTGKPVGKVRYMSPEQARGEAINRRADIYSLGLVLWELLTEEPAFQADNELALLELVRAPQPRSLPDHRPDVPAGLGEAIQMMTAVEPKDRPTDAYATARMLAAAIPAALFVDPRQLGEYVRRRNAWASRALGKHGRDFMRPGSTPVPQPIGQGQTEPARATSGELQPFLLEPQDARASSVRPASGFRTDPKTWWLPLQPDDALEGPPPVRPPTVSGKMKIWSRALVWIRDHRNFAIAGGLVLAGLILVFVVSRTSAPERSVEQPSTGAKAMESQPPAADEGKGGAAPAPLGATGATAEGALGSEDLRTEAAGSAPIVSIIADDTDEDETAAGDRDEVNGPDKSASLVRPADKSPSSSRRKRHRDRRKAVAARREAANASEPRPSEARLSESGPAQAPADEPIIRIDGVSLARDPDAPVASPDGDDRDRRRRKVPTRVGDTPIAEGFEEK